MLSSPGRLLRRLVRDRRRAPPSWVLRSRMGLLLLCLLLLLHRSLPMLLLQRGLSLLLLLLA